MKYRTLLKITTLCAVASVTACNNNVGSTPSITPEIKSVATKPTIITNAASLGGKDSSLRDGMFTLRMGSVYDSSANSAPSPQSCLVGATDKNNVYIANPEAVVELKNIQGLEDVEKDLGVNVSGQYGGDRFSASIAADFANSSKDNDYTTNLIYLYKYTGAATFKPGVLGNGDDALVSTAKSFVHTHQDRFREMCGDSYIAEMDAGALLVVRLTLSFNSHVDQEKFKASADLKAGLANISTMINQAATSKNVHVNFSLSAMQRGGEPQRLNDIFGKIPGTLSPFLQCGDVRGPNVDACNQMIQNIIEYAQTMPAQLQNDKGEIDVNKLYLTNPKALNYKQIGVVVGAPDPSPAVFNAMEQLTKNYDTTIAKYQFVDHYLTALSSKLDTASITFLKGAKEKLNKQLNLVYLSPSYQILNCYKGYVSENCVNIKANIDQGVANYALNKNEQNTLNYLYGSAYKTDLYVYDGESTSSSLLNDFKISSGCVIAPISLEFLGKFALNCEGKWLDTPNLTLAVNMVQNTFTISGLSYLYSKNITIVPQYISYASGFGINLDERPEAEGVYYGAVETSLGANKVNTNLMFTKQEKNPA